MKQSKLYLLKRQKRSRCLTTLRVCLGGTVIAAGTGFFALPARADDAERLGKLEKENAELLKRLDALEGMARKEGILPSGDAPKPMFVKALSTINISGFVTTSYFYDTSTPADHESNGYLWNTRHNSFSLNKVKLTLASAEVQRSGDKWDVGFRTSMIWGEDSSLVNTGGETQGFEGLREAFVELNAPLGTGLNIRAGQLISLLNYESGDGGAANANFSQGYQWFFTGNGPSAGVQLGYNLTEKVDVKLRVMNGLYGGAIDGNDNKTFMGALGLKPDEKGWISLVGFAGDGNPVSAHVAGGSILGGRQWTKEFNTGWELDYFNFTPNGGGSADLWSIGGWFGYDFNPIVGLALRAEYMSDPDGFGLKNVAFPGRPGSAITSPDADGDVVSFALTLNWKPLPYIKVQPEIRYDHTSYKDGFDGKESRVTIGAGVSYLF